MIFMAFSRHLFRRISAETAAEYGHLHKDISLLVCQEMPGMLKDRPHASVALGHVSHRSRKEVEVLLDRIDVQHLPPADVQVLGYTRWPASMLKPGGEQTRARCPKGHAHLGQEVEIRRREHGLSVKVDGEVGALDELAAALNQAVKIKRGLRQRVLLPEHLLLAFLDINPLSPGHTLVIPREPAETLDQLSDEASAAIGRVLPRICRAVQSVTGTTAYNVLQNNGTAAHQVVMHVHFHIIPKPEGGGGLGMTWDAAELDHADAAELAQDIAGRLGD